MRARLLRFSLIAAHRRIGTATYRRGEGPTLAPDSPLALQLLAEPATWSSREILGHVAGDVAEQQRATVVGGQAAGCYASLLEALEAAAVRVDALPLEDRRQYDLLVAEALRSGGSRLAVLMERALDRAGVESLLADRDVAGESADLADLEDDLDDRPPFVGPDLLEDDPSDVVLEADAPPEELSPADQARARLRLAVAAPKVALTLAELRQLAVVAGFPQADDASGWGKARLVDELAAWLSLSAP